MAAGIVRHFALRAWDRWILAGAFLGKLAFERYQHLRGDVAPADRRRCPSVWGGRPDSAVGAALCWRLAIIRHRSRQQKVPEIPCHSHSYFPGQGSQSVGMLARSPRTLAVIEATFAQASEVARLRPVEALPAGSRAELNATECTQPAMLTAGVATYRLWRERGGRRAGADGRATAWASSRRWSRPAASISVPRSTWCAFAREAMQAAVPAGPGRHGGDPRARGRRRRGGLRARPPHGEVVEAVNFNAPGQVVIAGARRARSTRAIEPRRARAARSAPCRCRSACRRTAR